MAPTAREREILDALLWKIRLLTLGQAARGWWTDAESGRRHARKRLGLLTDAGLLLRVQAPVRPVTPLIEPLVRWRPGEPPPNFHALSWRCQKRWTEPPRTTLVYCASPKAIRLLGGSVKGEIKEPGKISHDAHLAEVFITLKLASLSLAESWRGEDALAPSRVGQKLPDAMLCDSLGQPHTAIEFGAGYPAVRIREFHDDCAARSLPYELW